MGMLSKFNAATGYLGFDQCVRQVEAWASRTIPSLGCYNASTIAARSIQRVVEVALVPYLTLCAKHAEQGLPATPSENQHFECGGLIFDSGTGRVYPTLATKLRSLAEFGLHWLHVLKLFSFAALLRASNMPGSATLLFGVGAESIQGKDGDSQFIKYCRTGPIAPLTKATRLVIQSLAVIESSDKESVRYARFPLHKLVRLNPPNLFEYLHFLLCHIKYAAIYVGGMLHYPVICLLGRDFAYHAMVESLNDRQLIDAVVITNSSYSAQPLWMRNFPQRQFMTHMVWYAQNTIPFTFADNPVQAALPNNRHIVVDETWVWTHDYSEYLENLGVAGRFHVVGPILWRLPELIGLSRELSNEIVLMVFDVVPVTQKFAESIGIFRNYYNADNMQLFLHGVMRTKELLTKRLHKHVKVILKHKRAYYAQNDADYIALVEHLRSTGDIELAPYGENMYSLVNQADIVIAIPYSSPVHVAHVLKIPSVYFDPASELLPTHSHVEDISFAAGQSELFQVIHEHVSHIKEVH